MAEKIPDGIGFREDINAWWPDYDHAPVKCYGFVQHGLPAIAAALRHCRKRRECVQAGGHAGFWPKELAEHFDQVHTFEPEARLFECMARNCTAANVRMYRHGLGASAGTAKFKAHISAGSWRVDPAGEHLISLLTVDALALKHCDAILLDIEGYEVEALQGAAGTIERCRPVILVELLPRSAEAIGAWLAIAGYRQVERFGRDGIYIHAGSK